jgi:hypothetical protein
MRPSRSLDYGGVLRMAEDHILVKSRVTGHSHCRFEGIVRDDYRPAARSCASCGRCLCPRARHHFAAAGSGASIPDARVRRTLIPVTKVRWLPPFSVALNLTPLTCSAPPLTLRTHRGNRERPYARRVRCPRKPHRAGSRATRATTSREPQTHRH